jgi:NTE family protein
MKNIEIEHLIQSQNQPVEYAVFSGGGAKGVMYSGVHQALSESKVLNGLKVVAGSSAGAMSAAFIAAGVSTNESQKFLENNNIKALLGKGFIVNKDGNPLYEAMAKIISNSVKDYLENTDLMSICNQRLEVLKAEKNNVSNSNLPKEDIQKKLTILAKQQLQIQTIIDNNGIELNELLLRSQQGDKIYFKDISLLRALDPIKFKDLVITATRKKDGALSIFDSWNTPEVEIALACRASASLPVLFKPVKINGIEYVDGGYRDNIPLSYFKNKDIDDLSTQDNELTQAKKEARPIAIAFGSNMQDSANIAIYSVKKPIFGNNAIIKFLTDVVFKSIARVGGKFKYSETESDVYNTLRNNALNTIILDSKTISTTSFDKAQNQSKYLHLKGYMQTMRHFDNHEIINELNPNFVRQEFLLKVYEGTQDKSFFKKITDKVVGSNEVKTKGILLLCKADKWKKSSSSEVFSEFIALAATRRTDGQLNVNTNSMNLLVKSLNDKDTPQAIKEDFLKLLEIDTKKDIRFKKDKSFSENVIKFKFKDQDFNILIEKLKASPLHSHNFENHSTNKYQSNRRNMTIPIKDKISPQNIQERKNGEINQGKQRH